MNKIIFLAVIFAILLGASALAEENITINSSATSSSSSSVYNSEKKIERQENREKNKSQRIETKNDRICDRISELADKVGGKIDEKENAFNAKREERISKWNDHLTVQNTKVAQIRLNRDANFEEHFQKLEESAVTDEQKKAVDDFEAAVKAALALRRSAVDSAMNNFREGVKNAIGKRKTDADQSIAEFDAERQSSFQKAQTACASGANAQAASKALHAYLQAAKTKLHASMKSLENVGNTVSQLAAARKQAVEKAHDDFKAAMEKARVDLKKVFPENSD